MKRLIIVVLVLMLSGCSLSVPEGFEQALLEEKTQKVIDLMVSLQAQDVIDLMRKDLQTSLKAEDLEKILESKYETVKETKAETIFTISDTKDPQSAEVYATVIAQVEHELGRATYTLSFNTDYELVGLYIK